MNIALLVAGGKGERAHQGIPKQFLSVCDKPILIYTLEAFQIHPDIDEIVVICLEGWQEILKSYAKQYKVDKLTTIITGGDTVQDSIYNGVVQLKEKCRPNDIVIIHDGIRPCVSSEIISDSIVKCKTYGNGVSAMPYFGQIFWKENEISSQKYIQREQIMCVYTPQAYSYSKLLWAYEEMKDKNIGNHGWAYTNTLMVDLNETVYFSAGSSKNMKITTSEDIEIFKALVQSKNGK